MYTFRNGPAAAGCGGGAGFGCLVVETKVTFSAL